MSTKALMVFCEGPYDVAFCRLVFGKLLKTKKFEHKFDEFPAPLNNLFKAQLEHHLLQDMSLDMAHKFFLPDSVLRLERGDVEWLVLLFNCGGKDQINNPKGFGCGSFETMLASTKTGEPSHIKGGNGGHFVVI